MLICVNYLDLNTINLKIEYQRLEVETFEFSKFYSWYENISLDMKTFLITFVDAIIVHSGASRLAMFSITFAHAKHQIIKTQINT